MDTNEIILLALVVLTAFGMMGLVLHYRFLSWLRDRQAATWKELGSPTLFTNNSLKNYFAVRKFIKNMTSSSASDQEMVSRGRTLLLFNNFYLAVCVTILLTMAYILTRR
jgi:hypothetical protein